METAERRDTVERRVPVTAERIQRIVRGRSGRFISRGRLAASSLYWLGWIIVSPRAIVSAGVQREIEALGVGALRLVASASVLVGLITTFQVATQLTAFGAENMAGRAIGWFAARELGPLAVAILVIARSAAGTAGEFASMAAGGELDALRAMGLDPAKYLVAPKLAAFLVALPTLTIFADGLIVLGGWLGSSVVLGYSTQFFLEQFRSSFDLFDIFVGVAKSLVFALVIALVAADEGLSVRPHVESIGAAATRAVVFCLIGVLGADTVINAIVYFIPGLS
jgi:phospholipid/cholesterol/gamma-HCH transport system permease protein